KSTVGHCDPPVRGLSGRPARRSSGNNSTSSERPSGSGTVLLESHDLGGVPRKGFRRRAGGVGVNWLSTLESINPKGSPIGRFPKIAGTRLIHANREANADVQKTIHGWKPCGGGSSSHGRRSGRPAAVEGP